MTTMPERPARPATPDGQRPAAGPDESGVPIAAAIAEHRHWLRLFLGVFAIALGGAACAWPEATLQVVAVLFGLHLVVTGFLRAGLSLFLTTSPVFYRLLSVVFGVLTGLIGILCL